MLFKNKKTTCSQDSAPDEAKFCEQLSYTAFFLQ